METELQLDYYFTTLLYRPSKSFDGFLEMAFQNKGVTGVFFDGIEVLSKEQVTETDYTSFKDITHIMEQPPATVFRLVKVTEDRMGNVDFHLEEHGILDVKSVLDFNEDITQRVLFIPQKNA